MHQTLPHLIRVLTVNAFMLLVYVVLNTPFAPTQHQHRDLMVYRPLNHRKPLQPHWLNMPRIVSYQWAHVRHDSVG